MFYRYEVRLPNSENWDGICSGLLDPSERRFLNRYLRVPKWYATHKNIESRCWLTEEGYRKYYGVFEKIIEDIHPSRYSEIRCIATEDPGRVLRKGKIQTITEPGEYNGVTVVKKWETHNTKF